MNNEPKPGAETSEFRLTIASMIAGLLLAAVGAFSGLEGDVKSALIYGGLGLAGVPTGAYAIARGKAKAVAGAMLPLVMLTSCEALEVDESYVRGDRATFDVVAPIVRDLADEDPENDPDLSGVNGRAVLNAVDTWETRLTAAESGGDQ